MGGGTRVTSKWGPCPTYCNIPLSSPWGMERLVPSSWISRFPELLAFLLAWVATKGGLLSSAHCEANCMLNHILDAPIQPLLAVLAKGFDFSAGKRVGSKKSSFLGLPEATGHLEWGTIQAATHSPVTPALLFDKNVVSFYTINLTLWGPVHTQTLCLHSKRLPFVWIGP